MSMRSDINLRETSKRNNKKNRVGYWLRFKSQTLLIDHLDFYGNQIRNCDKKSRSRKVSHKIGPLPVYLYFTILCLYGEYHTRVANMAYNTHSYFIRRLKLFIWSSRVLRASAANVHKIIFFSSLRDLHNIIETYYMHIRFPLDYFMFTWLF
jgi:hypothetical protein